MFLYVKPTYKFNDSGLELAIEWLLQNRVGDGGNADPDLRYVQDEYGSAIRCSNFQNNFEW